MPKHTTVSNTDHATISHDAVMPALAQLGGAQTLIEVSAALETFGQALGLPHCLMLHLGGGAQALRNAAHNLSEPVDPAALINHDVTAALLERPLPVLLEGQLKLRALQAGVAVAARHGNTTCVLYLGCGAAGLVPALLAEQMGLACMAASHLADSLHRLALADCPLTVRELECLCFAAAGASTKETARELNISHRTVEEYIARCRKRLGAESTMAAAVQAVRQGWISDAEIEALEQLSSRRQYGAGRG